MHALTGCAKGCSLHFGLRHAQFEQQGLTYTLSWQGSVCLCLLQGLAVWLLSMASHACAQEGMLMSPSCTVVAASPALDALATVHINSLGSLKLV